MTNLRRCTKVSFGSVENSFSIWASPCLKPTMLLVYKTAISARCFMRARRAVAKPGGNFFNISSTQSTLRICLDAQAGGANR